jgi:glutamate synthase domain-containing protein 2/glutamate synthase domain-containing protein 1/glutamate synthase domain-containing protein 3
MRTECRSSERGLYEPETERANCGVGFVADLNGAASHRIIEQALRILVNLEHRGACGGDGVGDGAGILLQIPDGFFRAVRRTTAQDLPSAGSYGVGMLFLPVEADQRNACEQRIVAAIAGEQLEFLGFRDVPTCVGALAEPARENMPCIRQVFVGRGRHSEDSLERRLFVLRRVIEKTVAAEISAAESFSIPSLSSRKIVYKGLLQAPHIELFYEDLQQPNFVSALALVHQRYSTNTFPSWKLAHPFRFLCHNGEINTLKGNCNWLRARESTLASELFGTDLAKVLPLIPSGLSDSASLDAMVELLVHGGRSLPHVMTMLIPEAWQKQKTMSPARRAFYEFHSCLVEPWDGPALLAFTDGRVIGALLDRNGLRPARYLLTKDNRLVMASEAGALEVEAADVLSKGRLEPGKMLLVDTLQGRVVPDTEIKDSLAAAAPYGEWLERNMNTAVAAESSAATLEFDPRSLLARQRTFGYTAEDLQTIMTPMATNGQEAIGSMGSDVPLAVFSDRPLPLYDYFKQLFAQVTNPPIDAIREDIVTSTQVLLGAERNLLQASPEHCRRVRLDSPVLTDEDLDGLRESGATSLKIASLAAVFPVAGANSPEERGIALRTGIDDLCESAGAEVREGANVIVLSDRSVDAAHAPIPALLACSAVHHHLIRNGLRTACSLIVESGEPREVHHLSLLVAYGASAVNPYLAFASLRELHRRGKLRSELSFEQAKKNYANALAKGLVKVMSKMGISVAQSYCGAQIFEALGIDSSVVEQYFCGTPSRIGGISLEVIAEDIFRRHSSGFDQLPASNVFDLDLGGQYQWRRLGERHLNNPTTIATLQHAVRGNSFATFRDYSSAVDEHNRRSNTLRGLLEFSSQQPAVVLDEVEPAKEIVKRFKTGAMSFGSISFEAHANLAIAMNRIGGRSNSGEGGEDARRFPVFDGSPESLRQLRELSPWLAEHLRPGDSLRSGIKQVASARFGVTSEYLVNADELQIKIAQGAKPGEGGQLPGHKVDAWIAAVRHATPGVQLISPPPHHDIYSIEDLAQLIYDLKNANQRARISVKLVSEVGVGTIAAGVAKAKADAILISGADGGTGASPLSSIKHAGLPWELGLAEAHQVLSMNRLRDRVILETDGQLKTGRDVAIACLLGAEEFGFSTAPMIAQGCVMMRKCHLNTCPVGIATQDPELRKHFNGKPEYVINFMFFIAEELRLIMAGLGFRSIAEMTGQVDCLRAREEEGPRKSRTVNVKPLLVRSAPDAASCGGRTQEQQHDWSSSLDRQVLLELAKPALEEGRKVVAELEIRNIHRSVGVMTGSELSRRYGAAGLPDETLHVKFQGSAGQSFAAFLPRGMRLDIEGEVNDYCGKGLSGGIVCVFPPIGATFRADKNVIAGNTAFYGATAGEGYISGRAGERFCVRNSGASVVVEGIGDHGCEYMTGGRVVILGATGRNFAAGMSGGVAYVLDREGTFAEYRCNAAMVALEHLSDKDEQAWVQESIRRHVRFTGSPLGRYVLSRFQALLPQFIKIIPTEYKKALQTVQDARPEYGNQRA